MPAWPSERPVVASAAVRTEASPPVNPSSAIGQIIVSIALIAAILLQARGTGLSGTFGGDSAVYRSRRGVERRLWQFTIVLLVLFVIFSLASYIVSRPSPPDGVTRRRPRHATDPRDHGTESNDPDRSVVVGTLVVLLALVAGLIGVPALNRIDPDRAPRPGRSRASRDRLAAVRRRRRSATRCRSAR